MEASTQPQQAIPSPDLPLKNEQTSKKNKWPLIISLLLLFIIIVVLIALFLLSQNKGTTNTNNIVSAPVIQTTTTPETTSGSTITPPPVADASLNPNNFDSRLFYLNFTSPNPITSDTTTRITYPDGTTWCFDEQATGQGINLDVYTGGADCHGSIGAPAENKFDLTSADSKVINFVAYQNDPSQDFIATGTYSSDSKLNMHFKLDITGTSLDDVKAKATALVGTLSFDTFMMKSELTDKITTPNYGQP